MYLIALEYLSKINWILCTGAGEKMDTILAEVNLFEIKNEFKRKRHILLPRIIIVQFKGFLNDDDDEWMRI